MPGSRRGPPARRALPSRVARIPRTRPPTSYPEHLRTLIEDYLHRLDFTDGDGGDPAVGLVEAMRHSLLAGGKRFRPVLALATCEALGERPERLLPTAAALELVHTYSLIHDDLPAMDDDDLRRGRPTCHVVFGEDTAILAGDALFAEAVRLVADRQEGGPEVQVGILREISHATGVGGMVGGQFLDLRMAGRTSPEALRDVHALKTGRLIACAVHCAILLGRPPGATERALRAFATELGLLFQIVDDILDVDGTQDVLGKSVGSDQRKNKATYVSAFGLDRARELAGEARERALAALDAVGAEADDLRSIAEFTWSRRS
jgi:geranylgeranyl diphosphate synthase, type II